MKSISVTSFAELSKAKKAENTLEVKKVRAAHRRYVITCFFCGKKVYAVRDNKNQRRKMKGCLDAVRTAHSQGIPSACSTFAILSARSYCSVSHTVITRVTRRTALKCAAINTTGTKTKLALP